MGYGLIEQATHNYIVTMAFARQPIDRRLFELAAFSLPAVAACVALVLIPHGYNANQAGPVVMSVPLVSSAQVVRMPEASPATPVVMPVAPSIEAPAVMEAPQPSSPQAELAPAHEPVIAGSPQAPEITPSQPHAIIVQTGHTLWRIARETYGYGRDYPVIVNANRNAISKPELIHPGQQLVLPDKKAN